MKTLVSIFLTMVSLYASVTWDPYTASSIERYLESSFQARFQTNDSLRSYSTLSSLIKDDERYGVKEISAYAKDTQRYIDVQSAFFVYPLSQEVAFGKYTSKAFASHANAISYAKAHKAEVIKFDVLLPRTKQAMPSDEALMQARYAKRVYPMGKRVYEKRCKDATDPTEFMHINGFKDALQATNVCESLEEEKMDALTLYLWNVKRKGDLGEVEGRIEVAEEEKCPVCGMFVYKYPKWAAQLFIKHDNHEHHLSFDGVKDMMKFYLNPSKWGNYAYVTPKTITKVFVSDYYSGKGIDGRKAFYVIRSDIYGPMGHEFIPFSNQEEANTFLKEHRGSKLLHFDEITEKMAYELDVP